MKLTLTVVLAAVSAALAPSTAGAQFYSYQSRVRNQVILGGPLGPAPLDPYSVSSYFGWLPSPIVARQTVGHQVISTGPNGYVYRPVYADELNEQGPIRRAAPPRESFASRHGATVGDPPAMLRPTVAPPGKRADAAFEAALADVRGGQYDLALGALQAILDRAPKRGDAELLAAQALFALSDYPGAVAALGRAVELLPEAEWDRYVADYRHYFPSSLTYIVLLRRLERQIDLRPDDPNGFLLLGYHYGALGFADEAQRLFDQAKGEPLARRLGDHFGGRRAGNDDAPVPEDVAEPEAENEGPREF
ncbi:MAG TPA: tetratricopeptide repeat protein [Pirellulales bacterium]|nr:tetratricopeptide repeat protein [Pirellulales bacterium]